MKRFNLRNTQEIKEFSEVSKRELFEIYEDIMEYYKIGTIQKAILVKLLNYERRHNKMMYFDDLCTATRCKPNLTNMLVKRLTKLINIGLITYSFDEENTNAYTIDECYEFGLTPKGKRFIDFMRGIPNYKTGDKN